MRKVILFFLILIFLGLMAYHFLGRDVTQKVDALIGRMKGTESSSPSSHFQKTQDAPVQAQQPQNILEGSPKKETVQDADAILVEETNAYVDCLNRTVPRVTDSRSRYLSWVSESAGPHCKERYISYSLYTLYPDGIEKCRQAAERGKAGPPELPKLETAAEELAQVYASLVPLVQGASDYYEQQDYLDDGCAKGKELHPKLMAAFNRFIELSDAMRLELDGAKAGLTERQLARIEAQAGRNLQWHTTKFMLSVDRVMKGLSSDGRAPLNREAYTGAFDAMEIDYQALTDYAAQKPEESQQTMMFSAFQSESQSYYKNAKFLKRSLASGKTPTPRELSELFRDYNELVNWSNLLKFPDEKI